MIGRQNKHKKLVVVAIERKSKGISRMYGKVIDNASNKSFRPFFETHIDPAALIKTDEWTGYRPLKKDFPNLVQVPSGKKGETFPDLHRAIMLFQAWLRGLHHSVDNLQAYIDEYVYRFNRSFMGGSIFENLINKMLHSNPVPYREICIYSVTTSIKRLLSTWTEASASPLLHAAFN